jgi:hypothetical protein
MGCGDARCCPVACAHPSKPWPCLQAAGSAPVSGAAYSLNSQPPPCAFLVPFACSFDIPGNDIPSNGKSFTQVCIPTGSTYKGKTGFGAWQAYCDDTPGCEAAVAPVEPNGCAYLKAKGTRDVVKADPKWAVVTSKEKPSSCAKFVANGEQCTSDPWAAQQICE